MMVIIKSRYITATIRTANKISITVDQLPVPTIAPPIAKATSIITVENINEQGINISRSVSAPKDKYDNGGNNSAI